MRVDARTLSKGGRGGQLGPDNSLKLWEMTPPTTPYLERPANDAPPTAWGRRRDPGEDIRDERRPEL